MKNNPACRVNVLMKNLVGKLSMFIILFFFQPGAHEKVAHLYLHYFTSFSDIFTPELKLLSISKMNITLLIIVDIISNPTLTHLSIRSFMI